MTNENLIAAIDDVLPQTQCGLCGYGGCRPYAEAIALKQETINKCPPGGLKTLMLLADISTQDATPFIGEMKQKAKPPSRAVIRESECIGCTKCIQACPVDAIMGAAKLMHTVIAQECTGCELCLEPCPVDCIDMIQVDVLSELTQREKSNSARQRFLNRNERLQASAEKPDLLATTSRATKATLNSRKVEIQEAIARVKAKKVSQDEC